MAANESRMEVRKIGGFYKLSITAVKSWEITIIIDSIGSKTCQTGNKVLLVFRPQVLRCQPTVRIITFIITPTEQLVLTLSQLRTFKEIYVRI